MYKVKIVFLYTDDTWSYQWADCNNPNEIGDIVPEYQKAEEKALKEDNIDKEIKHVVVIDIKDATQGKYNCGSCECYFDLDDMEAECPYCGSGNFVEGEIDEPEPKKLSGPRLYKP